MRINRYGGTTSRIATAMLVTALAATGVMVAAAPATAGQIAVQDADAELYALFERVEAQFGDDPDYAGAHLVNELLTVNVTSQVLAARVSSLGAATRLVSTPLAKLRQAAETVRAQGGDAVLDAAADISENRLYVMVLGSGPDARAAGAIDHVRTAGVPVTVQNVGRVEELGKHYGGWGITSNWRSPTRPTTCSAGFNARNSGGRSVVITAGHCGPVGSNWHSTVLGGFLGRMNRRAFAGTDFGNDWGIIGAFAGVHSTPPAIKDAGVTKSVRRHRQPIEGERACRNGKTSHTRCGRVARFLAGRAILTNIFAAPGDSGGPLYHRIPNTNRVVALGITTRIILNRDGNVIGSIYQPIGEILNRENLRLKTRQ